MHLKISLWFLVAWSSALAGAQSHPEKTALVFGGTVNQALAPHAGRPKFGAPWHGECACVGCFHISKKMALALNSGELRYCGMKQSSGGASAMSQKTDLARSFGGTEIPCLPR